MNDTLDQLDQLDQKPLRFIEWAHRICALVLVGGGVYYSRTLLTPDPKLVSSIIVGALVSIANFGLIKRAVFKITGAQAETTVKAIARFLVKTIILIGILALLLNQFGLSPLGFLIGFSSLVVSILIYSVVSLF